MPDGVTEDTPAACSPILANDWMIELANAGPLTSSHQKKPVKMMKGFYPVFTSPLPAPRDGDSMVGRRRTGWAP